MSEKLTILYVDDEPLNLMLFEEIFSEYYNIITAETGFVGLDQLNSCPEIKVVISDMKMPGMNGIEFIILAKKKFKDVKYFILTGYNKTADISDALKNGLIFKYFCKPFNTDEINASITESLKNLPK
jgi:response regulator RpfG family c-di-GMP phosphodiesterase